ncbi:S-layer homology domain-containing protein, partial [Clostridioides difficile]
MAKLMVELLGYGDLVSGSKSNFTDTQGHWADQWIALAAGRGIVIGTGDGKFNPEGIVTYDQVLTMLVRGLGYTDASNELKNMTWPTNFKVKAAELNITKNVNMGSTQADRGGVAQAMFNALDQQLVKVNSDGDIVKEFTTEGSRTDIPVNLITRIAIPNYNFVVGFEHINPDSKDYAGD